MDVFDMIGPVMIGPSSSHTAGAAKIGYLTQKELGETVEEAIIEMHGSYATSKGYKTDLAIVGGLMGMQQDDEKIRDAFEIAAQRGMQYQFRRVDLGKEVDVNTARITAKGASRCVRLTASSIGGGVVKVIKTEDLTTKEAQRNAGI